jgi:hypothetical protein
MNIVTITGAKAPTKVEFNPAEEEIERLVQRIVEQSGHEDIVDADVIELTATPVLERARDPEEIYDPDAGLS